MSNTNSAGDRRTGKTRASTRRTREQSARERIAAQQAAARQAEARRRAMIVVGSVVVVIAAIVGIIIAKSASPTTPASAPPPASATSTAALTKEVTSVPASALNAVGAGPGGASKVTPLTSLSGQPLTVAGKPDVLYIGAEYCPFCAAERWALAVALSRFGTFSGLHFIRSTSSDIFSNTSTLSFYKSTYTSKYVTFSPVETQTVTGATLQPPTAAQQALLTTYDAPPYVPSSAAGTIPFVDLGNRFMVNGAQYVPSVLGSTPTQDAGHFGLSWSQIAADLHDPSTPVAQSVLGAANYLTAGMCKLTGGQPVRVCQSKGVLAIGKPITALSSPGSNTGIVVAIIAIAVIILAGLALLARRRTSSRVAA